MSHDKETIHLKFVWSERVTRFYRDRYSLLDSSQLPRQQLKLPRLSSDKRFSLPRYDPALKEMVLVPLKDEGLYMACSQWSVANYFLTLESRQHVLSLYS